jgi:LmbE family N-acetylglucosaminyl deacetylase
MEYLSKSGQYKLTQEIAMEITSYTLIILAFVGTVLFVTARQRTLRRTMQRARLSYWLILAVCSAFTLLNLYCDLYGPFFGGQHQFNAWFGNITIASSIIALSGLVLLLVYNKVPVERAAQPRRILAIGAHPDDLEIACGGTLAKLRDTGHEIHGLVLTSGERGGNAALRPNEAQRGAQFLGLNSVRVMSFKDTCLKEQTVELVQTIEETVKMLNPDIIFTHSANDQHQDHQAVHEATLRAARNHSAILCYESPSTTKSFQPALFVDINNYVDIKIESIKEHRDQRTKPYMTPERVRGTAIFRGGQAKTRYAEGFEVVRVLTSALGAL